MIDCHKMIENLVHTGWMYQTTRDRPWNHNDTKFLTKLVHPNLYDTDWQLQVPLDANPYWVKWNRAYSSSFYFRVLFLVLDVMHSNREKESKEKSEEIKFG